MTESHALTLEHALLGILRHQPMHGYEIWQHLTEPSGLRLIWRLKQSHLYALLAKLEDLGYITGTLEPQGAKPPRRMLRLTPAGESAFADWQSAPVGHARDFRQEFLAKLYFALLDGPVAARQLIATQRAAINQWRQRHEMQFSATDASLFPQLVFDYRLVHTDAILAFLGHCDEKVASSLSLA